MSGHLDPSDHSALPLAAQVAGIPARTLRNWIGGGTLAAIRGQRGYLVRMAAIDRVRQLIGHRGHGGRRSAGRGLAFTQELLAPFIAEPGEVREELGRRKAEAAADRTMAELRERADQAERLLVTTRCQAERYHQVLLASGASCYASRPRAPG